MAFNFMLCRASQSLLPLAIPSVGPPRTFHRAIPTFLSVERRRLGHGINRQSFLPFSALTAEQPISDVSQVLDSEIQLVEEPKNIEGIPDDFPFEIQDNAGERKISLVRKYNNEHIIVEVDEPRIVIEFERDEYCISDEPIGSWIPLTVGIFKGDCHYLEFAVTAFREAIKIDSMKIKDRDDDEHFSRHEHQGPDFDDLDENLQQDFFKYLAVRGIEPSITNFLMEYMLNKGNKENLLWLKGLKHFVDK